jgi:7-carboxy-7-deazaguanine synthase
MDLVEIFSSVQGEGTHVGESTLFVRLGGCDLRCRWCDSPHTWRPTQTCRFETARGSGVFREVENPVSLDDAVAAAEALDAGSHRFVSLTGGEPLLQPGAVRELARALRARGPRIHLETHGLASEALAQVLDQIDVIAMDWKLASDVHRAEGPEGDFHESHERFLRVARQRPQVEVEVKVVVTSSSLDTELEALCARIAAVDAAIPLVLQPVTPFGRVREAPDASRLLGWVAKASQRLACVRLIPQTHKAYGAL